MRLHEKPSAPALRPVNGFHLSPVAIIKATDRRPRFGMSPDRAAFRVAELKDTGPPNSSAHGSVRVDALGRADRAVAVRELGRVLAPGGRLPERWGAARNPSGRSRHTRPGSRWST